MPVLAVRELSKSFGGLQAVSGVDFVVEPGEILGLIGPNGAGKTTMFNLLTGFLHPDSGRIEYKGENIVGLRPDRVARKGIGRTFQLTLLFQGKTVRESLLVGYHVREKTGFWQTLFAMPSYRAEEERNQEKVLEVLEFMGMSDWKDRPVGALPHGLQRRLGVAQVLMGDPELLLLDEPLSGLSGEEMADMLAAIRKLNARGKSVIIVEHNMRGVMALCQRIAVLNYGKKIADGTPAEVRSNPAVIEAYLGTDRR